ncbi:MAG TPA: hypothetical protein VF384_05430 [Planctomycetota bacterium]
MKSLLLLCTLCLEPVCQDPAPTAQSPAPRALDVITLKNGDQLEGRITAEVDGYVELTMGPGETVGISRSQVGSVQRGVGPLLAAVDAKVPASSEWFVLYDAHGSAVGWLHTAVQVGGDGGLTVSEEYEFVEGRRRYQITSMCTAAPGLVPISSYFRERISNPMLTSVILPAVADGQSDRIVEERIVEAKTSGDRLHVMRLDRAGRHERQLEWAPGATFPLLARTLARHRGVAVEAAKAFDPALEELVVCSFSEARQRLVTLGGTATKVTEIAETTATTRNSTWIDANLQTVRRELAGPSLVALQSSAESARFAVGGIRVASSVVGEQGGEFGLWVPNPAWQVQDGMPPGQVVLTCDAHSATISLTKLDHFEPDTSLDAAADAVSRWFRLLHPGLRVDGRADIPIRDRKAVQLLAKGRSGKAGMRAEIDVIAHRGQFLALVCLAPAAAWDELAPDFEFLRRSIELSPQALSPTLQGPLAPTKSQAPEVRAQKRDTASAPARPAPIVRIPSDG